MQNKIIALTICMLATPTLSLAQTAPTPTQPPAQIAPPNMARNQNCTPTQAVPQDGTIAPQGSASGQSAEPLTDKLARTDGVLCPPTGIDAEIHAPTPQQGTTPVIPPPGSPGGNPNIIPK